MEYALIVAGGKGLRMGGELPKQFLPIGGKPVLMRTLEAFYAYNPEIHIILVLPHSQQSYWTELCAEHSFSLPHTVADGGETRFHSVKNGLAYVTTPGLVGVHDGVRHLKGEESVTVSRDEYKLVQTPQVFDADLLKQAYEQPYTSFFTDDASVVEAMGVSVYLAAGNRENIKITTPFDLKIAAALLDSCLI